MEDLQVIDGSVMEGGGQVVRMAMSLSCLLQKRISIINIRAGRSSPGLKPQHLAGLKLVDQMCGGQLKDCYKGSCSIEFRPQQTPAGGKFTSDTGTAGSVTLLLQVALPCALFAAAPTRFYLRGGTNVAFAPPVDFTQHVFLPMLRRFGADVKCDLKKRGYFPRGGGAIDVQVAPLAGLRAVTLLEAGTIANVTATVFTAGRHVKSAARLAAAVERRLQAALPAVLLQLESVREPAATSDAAGVFLLASTSTGCRLGGSALIGRWSEGADEEAAQTAVAEIQRSASAGACVDQYCQDQCVILMALADGTSRIRTVLPTLHTQTAIHIAQLMTKAKFTVEKCEGEDSCTIECVGVGLGRSPGAP